MTDTIDILFPEDQQEGTEATVTRWIVAEGDQVAAHDPVVEIETDKVVVEIAAPQAGRIGEIKVQLDEEANPGDVLCTLLTNEEVKVEVEPEAVPETPAPADTNKNSGRSAHSLLSPAVRQRAMEHQLDLGDIQGSGRDGRITLQDVEALIAEQTPHLDAKEADKKASQDVAATTPVAEGSDIIPHDRMRKRIADNMVASLMHTAPHVTAVFEADLSAVFRHRTANKSSFARAGSPLTLTAYFVAASITAIQAVPRVNSQWHDDHLEVFHHINVGIGTALGDQGLIVPVLQQAQNMDLKGIATQIADLTGRARENKLKPGDVRDGTFTISNHGVSGSLIATPIIINQPQSAILGVGKIEKRVKVLEVDGEDVISVRPMCYVSLTIDHRVLDGFQTNAFLSELVSTLESWT